MTRSPMTVLMAALGIGLLLSSACAFPLALFLWVTRGSGGPSMLTLYLVISAGGVLILHWAFSRPAADADRTTGQTSPDLPPSQPAPRGCGTILLGLLGFVLLIPGLCSVPFAWAMHRSDLLPFTLTNVVLFLPFAIAFVTMFVVGLRMIVATIRS